MKIECDFSEAVMRDAVAKAWGREFEPMYDRAGWTMARSVVEKRLADPGTKAMMEAYGDEILPGLAKKIVAEEIEKRLRKLARKLAHVKVQEQDLFNQTTP